MAATPRADKASKKEQKTKTASRNVVDANDSDGELHYEPPPGAILLDHDGDAAEFDYDELKDNDDLELWVMRVPHNIKPKYLNDFQISLPSSSHSGPLGGLTRKTSTYDIWPILPESEDAEDVARIRAEELLGLTCLLPRKKKDGKLFLTPTPISRHLVLTASLPTSDPSPIPHQNPARYCHPPEILKHRFLPIGAVTKTPLHSDADVMEIDDVSISAIGTQESVTVDTNSKSKEKKRKVETDTPKKSKKQKTVS